ncbi:MAG: type II CAAX endopeptidase family protein [Bryobacteraceae bacterium]
MRERLGPSDFRFLLICLVILGVTVWFSARYFYRAFPEASIDFKVTRNQSGDLARKFLAAQGLRTDGYRDASRFGFDEAAKTFLERELGLDRANRLMGTRIRLWRWSWRWFRPLQKEEFRVDVTPAGDPVGFRHEIAEAVARPSLSPEQARTVAEQFLRDTMHRDPAGLEFVEGSSAARPARTDQTFTWMERDFDIRDATYRIEVTVQGDQIGGYREYLKVPENWTREYERLRSRNLTAQTIDTGLLMLLAVGLLVVLLLRVRSHDIRWRRAALVGATGAVLYFLSSWNSQPLADFSYPTTDSYGSFVAQEFLRNLMGALAAAGLLFVLTAGAEPLYRQSYPGFISLGNLFRPRGVRTRRFFLGGILGLTLTGIFVAYQTGFYMVAYRYGAWSPADVPYDDLLNTRLPWLFVLFGGFLPAVSEEFLFRMFAIPFLQKLLRNGAIAVVLAGFIWGFGHAGYPQQPFWIRGVEVGIGGVALGLVMRKWGILPTLVWHYSVDALYTALLLLRSHNLYFMLSGAASAGIMVLPVVIAGIAYLRRGGFEPETGLSNGDEGSSTAAPVEEDTGPAPAAPGYNPWSRNRRLAALAVVVAGALLLGFTHVQEFGDKPRFALEPPRLRAIAQDFARTQGFETKGCRTVAFPVTRWEDANARLTVKYFVARRDIGYVANAFERDVPLHTWTVRFFRPLQREEMQVSVDPEKGRVVDFNHPLREDQPGADIDPAAARRIASDFLAGRGLDPAKFDLKESTSEKKKARRDHTLVWEAAPGDPRNLDEARYRIRMQVSGDRVTGLRTFWKVPETFERARSQRNALSNILLVLRIAVLAGAMVGAIWLLVDRTRRGGLPWRCVMLITLPLGTLTAAAMAMQFPILFSAYDTAIPLETFQIVMITGLVIAALGMLIALAFGAALILALRPDAMAVFSRTGRRSMGVDALYATGLAAVLAAVVDRLHWMMTDRFHANALLSTGARTVFASASPAASGVAAAAQECLFWLAILVLIPPAMRFLNRWPGASMAAAFVVAAGFVPTGAHTPGEFALYFGAMLITLAAGFIFIRYFARDNSLAYLMAAWTLALAERATDLLSQPAAALRFQGGVLMALLAISLVWAVAPAFSSSKPITMVVRDPG